MKKLPKLERLNQLFAYDPETGELSSKRDNKRRGHISNRYRRIKVDGQYYQEHRIIWLMQTGNDPLDMEIDHINRVKTDNRWCNLRICTRQQNRMNNVGTGVYYDKRRKTWSAKIKHMNKLMHISTCECPLIARIMYEDKARELRGEFCSI